MRFGALVTTLLVGGLAEMVGLFRALGVTAVAGAIIVALAGPPIAPEPAELESP